MERLVELLWRRRRPVKILGERLLQLVLELPERLLVGDFFEVADVRALGKECHIRQKIQIFIKIQGKAELISELDVLIRRLQAVLFPQDGHYLPKAEDVKVHDDPAIFLGRDLLFFHFMPEQGVKILLLEAVRREGRRVLDPDVPLRQMLHHDPRFQNFSFLDHFLNTAPPGLLSAL